MQRTQTRIWIDAITDRSDADVELLKEYFARGWENLNADEKQIFLAGMKGAINQADLERIQSNVILLDEVLETNLPISDVPNIPTVEFLEEIISNIDRIRNAYMTYDGTPATPSMPLNTWQKWNDAEQILEDVYAILLNNFHYYCGEEIYCGDSTGFLL